MNVPFFENPDHTHCFQAVVRMVLKKYRPDKDYTWRELERITAKKDGLWTWPTAGILWLADRGLTVRSVDLFDYAEFADKGEVYLVEILGEAVARETIRHSDIKQEKTLAREIVEHSMVERRIPTIDEVKRRLDEGNLVICNVNSKALNDEPNYTGHFVLLTGYTDEGFIMHDPGPPGRAERLVSFAQFERAWAYPHDKAKNYIAVK